MAYHKLQVSILNFKEICRTCSQNGDLTSLVDVKPTCDTSCSIADMLMAVANIRADRDDGLPDQICTLCVSKLSSAYAFQKQCERFDNRFRSVVNSEFQPVVITNIVPLTTSTHSPDEDSNESDYILPGQTYHEIDDIKDEIIEISEAQQEDCYEDELASNEYEECEIYEEDEEEEKIEQLDDPIQSQNARVGTYMCQVCGKLFNYHTNLAKHLKTHGKCAGALEKPFGCGDCDRTFDKFKELKDHSVIDHGSGVFEPTMEIKENGEIIHVCNICFRNFPSKHGLSIHQAFHTNRRLDPDVEKPYICTVCDKTFITVKAMKNHKKTHGSKTYVCNVCQKAFSIKARLQIHVRTHTGEKPYSCLDCGKCFANTTSLRIHDLIHSGARPHYCKLCDRRFKQHSHLKNHLLTHSGLRPFECPECGKTFVFKGNLTVHMRMHSGETPYICPVCGKGFYDSSRMKKHHKTHNKGFI